MASTYTNLLVHIVFSTKNRSHTLGDLQDLHAYIGGVVNNHGAVAIAVGGVADHVHILASLKATTCVADLVRETKKAVAAWRPVKWQEGYDGWPTYSCVERLFRGRGETKSIPLKPRVLRTAVGHLNQRDCKRPQ